MNDRTDTHALTGPAAPSRRVSRADVSGATVITLAEATCATVLIF
jgi:hypothetical protein